MKRKEKLDFEINLLPVISMLAVCIAFLLLSTVWIHLASLDITQAHGTESSSEEQNKKTLFITFEESGRLNLEVKDSQGKSHFNRRATQLNQAEASLKEALASVEQLNSAIVRPHASTAYENLIIVMDQARKQAIQEIGVAPL